jgi:hypothetical protein
MSPQHVSIATVFSKFQSITDLLELQEVEAQHLDGLDHLK